MDRSILLYDEDCGFCRWSADRIRAWDRRGVLRFEPLQSVWAARLLRAVPPGRRAASWHLVESDGHVWSGGAAVPRLMRTLPGGAPIAMLAEAAPGATDRIYAAIARRRAVLGRLLGRRACSVDPSEATRPDPSGASGPDSSGRTR